MAFDVVPSFYLYGEPSRAVPEQFIHVEHLDDRSRPSEWTIRPHAHADLVQLFIVETGGGAMLAEGDRVAFTAPALLLIPAGVVHGFAWTTESKGSVMTLARSYLDWLATRDEALAEIFAAPRVLDLTILTLTEARTLIASLMREVGRSIPGHRAAVEGSLLNLLVLALRHLPIDDATNHPAPGHQTMLVARYRALLDQRFRLRESVPQHAATLGVSESSLRAACARIASMSPASMLDHRAVLEARRALLYSNLSVAEVGYGLGFTDPAYFSRFFTRHAGCSPRRYRREGVAARGIAVGTK
jgi:AraC family transcriptional activator of pobA